MEAQDVMTQFVISVGPDDLISKAVRVMLQHEISGVPVLDVEKRLVGMITEGDLLRRAETGTTRKRPRWLEFFVGPGKLADEYVHSHGRKVSEVMTHDPISVTEETPLEEVVSLMEKRRIKRVPVLRSTKVVGIVSRANLLHALARVAGEVKSTSADDKTIRQKLLDSLNKERWAPVGALDVSVRDGVVDLWGSITDERERAALIVAAENTVGVRAVRDHLAWIDPTTGVALLPPKDVTQQSAPL